MSSSSSESSSTASLSGQSKKQKSTKTEKKQEELEAIYNRPDQRSLTARRESEDESQTDRCRHRHSVSSRSARSQKPNGASRVGRRIVDGPLLGDFSYVSFHSICPKVGVPWKIGCEILRRKCSEINRLMYVLEFAESYFLSQHFSRRFLKG